jgi:hypothetical protein
MFKGCWYPMMEEGPARRTAQRYRDDKKTNSAADARFRRLSYQHESCIIVIDRRIARPMFISGTRLHGSVSRRLYYSRTSH